MQKVCGRILPAAYQPLITATTKHPPAGIHKVNRLVYLACKVIGFTWGAREEEKQERCAWPSSSLEVACSGWVGGWET
jgi:hypothetical protein